MEERQDLISRQAAIDALETIGYDFSDSGLSEIELAEVCEAVGDVRQDMIRMIKRLPPAQPEIIRCKDCGHWDTTWQNDFAPNYHYCSLVDGTRRGDFFCADAERRGEQNEID